MSSVILVHQQLLKLVYELLEDSTAVPKHAGVMKDYTDVLVMCEFVW